MKNRIMEELGMLSVSELDVVCFDSDISVILEKHDVLGMVSLQFCCKWSLNETQCDWSKSL